MNTKEVLALKEKPTEKIGEVINEYNEWVKEIRVLPNGVYWTTIVLCMGAIVYFKIDWNTWPAIILIFLSLRSLFVLANREGHKEGYLDGYSVGFGNGINETLGIDKKDEKFIEEIRIDQELNKNL